MVTPTTPPKTKNEQHLGIRSCCGSPKSLFSWSSVFLPLCAVSVVVTIVPLALLRFGTIEHAHFSGKFGNFEYSYQSQTKKIREISTTTSYRYNDDGLQPKTNNNDIHNTSMKLKASSKLMKSNDFKSTSKVKKPKPSSMRNKVEPIPTKKDDGCSVNAKVVPKWAPHSNPLEQTKRMNEISQCFHRISPQQEPLNQVGTNATYLQCHTEASLQILKQYRRVWFIGDSVLFQQYRSLLCMLEPQFQRNQYEYRTCGLETTYKHDLGETSLTYTEFGWKFDGEEPLYKTVFPQAIATSTQADAIVLNAGLHYDATRGHFLKRAMQFVKEQASKTNRTILVMEASDEQWPTSNGIWTMQCTGKCQCEALTPERRQGHGSWGQHHAEVSHDIGLIPPPQKSTYGYLYPGLFSQEESIAAEQSAHCVPSCLPANWRNDIIHSILDGDSTTSTTNLQVVPIWNQLVAHNQVHNRKLGDCTHKSIDALVMMNEQLIRTLQKSAVPNQRQGVKHSNPAPTTTCVKGAIGDKRAQDADIQAGTTFQKRPLPLPTTPVNNNKNANNNKLRVIVTGMEHTGTTILSELIMSAPGLIGPFETGFLLAETPSDFRQVTPFFEWLSRTDVTNVFLGLSNAQVQILLQQPTHTDMYTYAMENSALFKSIPSEWYVDKTPHYVYSLRQVMERAGPGVKVVVSMKSYEAAYKSWVTRRKASEAEFKAAYQLFQSSVQEASKAFPGQIYLQDYNALFGNYIKGKKPSAYVSGKLLFDWLGLEWKNEYFTGEDCVRKGRNCNVASLLDH